MEVAGLHTNGELYRVMDQYSAYLSHFATPIEETSIKRVSTQVEECQNDHMICSVQLHS